MDGGGKIEMLIVMRSIAVDTGTSDCKGRLVLANGLLVAILVHLDEPEHDHPGTWFLEAGFGRLQGVRAPVFDTLEDATRWLRKSIKLYP